MSRIFRVAPSDPIRTEITEDDMQRARLATELWRQGQADRRARVAQAIADDDLHAMLRLGIDPNDPHGTGRTHGLSPEEAWKRHLARLVRGLQARSP